MTPSHDLVHHTPKERNYASLTPGFEAVRAAVQTNSDVRGGPRTIRPRPLPSTVSRHGFGHQKFTPTLTVINRLSAPPLSKPTVLFWVH